METLQTIVAAISKVATAISTAANATGTLVVLALVAVVNYDIVARGVFNQPFHGAVELVQFAMALIVFLQLPDVARVGKLTRSDGFLLLVGNTRPKLADALRRVINLLSATLMALIAITIFPEFIKMWGTQDYFGVPGVFTAPWWPIKLTIFCSAVLCTVIFLVKVLTRKQSELTNVSVDAKVSET